jgi:hypothetical protein
MSGGARSGRQVHGLALLTLLSFIASFLIARAFTTVAPSTVVVAAGVHFHHFWYGLAMVVSAGWLAIVSDRPDLDRVYAIVFGLGAGLIGDEVGLLLTFGDYQSDLTYVFFVGVLSLSTVGFLLFRYRKQLEGEVLSLGAGERLAHLGVFVAGLSAVAWAFDQLTLGLAIFLLGVAATASGILLRRRSRAPPPPRTVGPPF